MPWENTNIGNSGGEFMVGQVFNLKADLQHTAKLYSISAHQEYVVVESTTKLLVLRCKKAKQSQCPWKLRAMVVKGTTSFAINKYRSAQMCKSLLESGPSTIRFQFDCCSYSRND